MEGKKASAQRQRSRGNMAEWERARIAAVCSFFCLFDIVGENFCNFDLNNKFL
jgi:hypothetical protein